uniref:Uncharacterized protein n=1 Tax=Oryza nivara TaxID=4536 RepID=A0A0E0IU29_ORYNI
MPCHTSAASSPSPSTTGALFFLARSIRSPSAASRPRDAVELPPLSTPRGARRHRSSPPSPLGRRPTMSSHSSICVSSGAVVQSARYQRSDRWHRPG